MTPAGASEPSFLVVGFSRSGTTLFSSLLSRHSAVTIPPETRFCHGVLPCGREDFAVHRREAIEQRVFAYWRIPDLEVDRAAFTERFAAEPATYARAFACLLECFREQTGKPLVGEKSPVHLLYVDMLLAWFPATRIVILVRDGRDVVESMVNAPFTHANRARHAAEWSYQSRLARAAAAQHAERVRVLRFEDLVSDTPHVLASVCEDLGIAFEAQMLRPSEASTTVPEWENDWKGQALEAVDAGKVAQWKTNPRQGFSAALGWYIMRDEINHWNYEMPEPAPGSSVRQLAAWLVSHLYRGLVYRCARRVALEARVLLHRAGLRKHL